MGLSLHKHSKERGEALETCPLEWLGAPESWSLTFSCQGQRDNWKAALNSEESSCTFFSPCCTLSPRHPFWCLSLRGFHLKNQGCYSRPSQCQHHQPSDTDTGLAVSPAHAGIPPNQLLHSRFRKASPTWKQEFGPKSTVTRCLSRLQTSSLHWLTLRLISGGVLLAMLLSGPLSSPGGDLNWGLEPSPMGGEHLPEPLKA